MHLPILKQGSNLIVPLPESLTDSGWKALREEVLTRVGKFRSSGVVIEVSAMDVMDSYATRILDGLARMVSLRGAQAVVVGISPGIAFSMVQLGLQLESAETALDLDEALTLLEQRGSEGRLDEP